ncbi:S-layer homology domain-containing protein [Oscillibacter valericigenes]|uniref:S-layer homology domain-containing protein n=1 Tax=Oscillibacter valericigenes TaxID=351091 RepID=A0ABS2FUU4_9FIRM|nr:S-layer homology domain-containing protein [Oscillibacter valericigenes]MBM6851402.1 S-layer homology domain-containing protein [Oscillibacter valericigenes]
MKTFLRKTLSLFLAFTLLCSLGLSAAASDALGEDLTSENTLLNQKTQLSTNVFWSTAYSDLRTENVITYEPNEDVTPIVTYGGSLTARTTVTAAARALEAQGYRVVAGINGDFFNTSNGLPIGLLVSDGKLLSSDGGYYAIGFRDDGSAVIGKPSLSVSADLGYALADSTGYTAEVVRTIAGVNKARVSTGGIYLYTYDFNDRHTTGNTEAGVDVLCTIVDGALSIGETATLRVDQVIEATSATSIGPDQVVLSANSLSSTYYTDALRNVPVGNEITLTITAGNEDWNDVVYAVGALYSLVQDGAVVSGLPSGTNPRTAVGVTADGSVVFYTIDGRRSGHSIGASLTQVAQRMIELGCVAAIGLDGGGSTTITVTQPDDTTAATINRPSDGSERAVTNHLFLVASNEPTGRLDHFYVQADNAYVLAGSKVEISAAAVDTNFIPMEDEDYDLDASDGELDGNILTTPREGGEITVTASSGRREGSTTVYAIADPTDIAIRNASGTVVTSLNTTLGASTQLTATAAWNHISLKADAEAFTWEVSGSIGTIDETGKFTASAPGTGTITVSAGGQRISIPVTVSGTVSSGGVMAVEDFEGSTTIFRGTGSNMDFSLNHSADTVRMGSGSAKVDYTLTETGASQGSYTSEWRASNSTDIDLNTYTALHMWVYGDGSGNQLYLLYSNGTKGYLGQLVTTLDFTGWKQVTVSLTSEYFEIQGLLVQAPATWTETGTVYADTPRTGTIYIDQITATASGTPDTAVPEITLTAGGDTLTATVADAVDGILPQSSISVTWDGADQTFTYDSDTGALSTTLISDGRPHRITVTARDASGNIGRASYDVPTSADWVPSFTDTQDYWAASYVDFLYNAGITTGYDDGTFRPNDNISRQQFAVMLFRYLGLDGSQYESVTLPFADTASIGSYALTAVKALYTEGIISGTTGSDGKLYFNPGGSLTRAQAAAMIGRTQDKGYATVELTFSDAASIPSYATFYIQTMAAQGVISGYADGTFKPGSNITRGQMAKILYTLM